MVEIIDLDDCALSDRDGMYGGMAGLKDGILYKGEYWIVKYPKSTNDMDVVGLSYTTAPLSEYIGSHIYEILGHEVHKTFLGIRNGKLVVACKDFCTDGQILLEVRTIKNAVNPEMAELLERDFSSTGSSHFVDMEELLLHLDNNRILGKVDGVRERFWDCVVIDALINNNDRNNGNWGILRKAGVDKLAPIFDNGASFSNKVPDDRLKRYLQDTEKIKNSSLNTTTTFEYKGKPLTVRKMFELENPDFQEAVLRNVPRIIEKFTEICAFIDSIPVEYNGIIVCAPERAAFYKKSMECRLEYIFIPCYEKLKFSL